MKNAICAINLITILEIVKKCFKNQICILRYKIINNLLLKINYLREKTIKDLNIFFNK